MIAIFPEISHCAKEGDIERLVLLVRRYFLSEKPFSPRTDIDALVNSYGVVVREMPMDHEAAICWKDENGTVEIVGCIKSRSRSPYERKFLLAHMLGHVLMDIQPKIADGELQTSGYRESESPVDRYENKSWDHVGEANVEDVEDRADRFAASLLMPAPMLIKAHRKIKDLDRLAQFFGATPNSVKRRLIEIGKIGAEPVVSPSNFIQAEQNLDQLKQSQEVQIHQNSERMYSEELDRAPRVPAAFAASNYVNMERKTQRAPKKAPEPPKATDQVVKTVERGLRKLRSLARQIDDSVKS